MKIYVNAIPPEGLDQQEERTAAELSIETDQSTYTDLVLVKARITKDKDILTVACNIKSKRRHVCSRCLASVDSLIDKDMQFVYQLTGEYTVDIDDNVRDTLMLDYPLKVLCSQDCKGLCISCGADLNKGACSCQGKEEDTKPQDTGWFH